MVEKILREKGMVCIWPWEYNYGNPYPILDKNCEILVKKQKLTSPVERPIKFSPNVSMKNESRIQPRLIAK